MCFGGGAPKEDPADKERRDKELAAERAELAENKKKRLRDEVRKQEYEGGTRSLLQGGSAQGFK